MRVHILGICGTFMGGIAALARALGHEVTGSDNNVYPPMSTQLQRLGIELTEGYECLPTDPAPDLVIVGNAMGRGNPSVEQMLNSGQAYVSGPEWLRDHLLADRHVLAVAGTHGKTTTSSLLAWLLEDAGLEPGYLIGGVPGNFETSARLGKGQYFVVEADEYDTAFFDKRSKFVHYRPRTLVLNNLEFDHADIFDDLKAIERQFHHLIRTVPGDGTIITNSDDQNLPRVLEMGCWTTTESFAVNGAADWHAQRNDGLLEFTHNGQSYRCTDSLPLTGQHNLSNACAALAAAAAIGIDPATAVQSLPTFKGVARRLQYLGQFSGVRVYDDFAHHPTAIATTLHGLRQTLPDGARLWVGFEPRSNSMRGTTHVNTLADSFAEADGVAIMSRADLQWQPEQVFAQRSAPWLAASDVAALNAQLRNWSSHGDVVVFMSNGGFDGAPTRFCAQS